MNGRVNGSTLQLMFTGILMSPVVQRRNWGLVSVFISGK